MKMNEMNTIYVI